MENSPKQITSPEKEKTPNVLNLIKELLDGENTNIFTKLKELFEKNFLSKIAAFLKTPQNPESNEILSKELKRQDQNINGINSMVLAPINFTGDKAIINFQGAGKSDENYRTQVEKDLKNNHTNSIYIFPEGTNRFTGQDTMAYIKAATQTIKEQTGKDVKISFSCHSRGGINLLETNLNDPDLLNYCLQNKTPINGMDPVLSDQAIKNLFTLIQNGSPVALMWGHVRHEWQKPYVEKLISQLLKTYPSATPIKNEKGQIIGCENDSPRFYINKPDKNGEFASHSKTKAALAFLQTKTQIS